MNLKNNLLLLSLICLSHAALYANFDDNCNAFLNNANDAAAGFIFGYLSGLVPIAGQQFLFALVVFGVNPKGNYPLFVSSAFVGHATGIATLVAAGCMCARCLRPRHPAPANRIAPIPSIEDRLTRLEEQLNRGAQRHLREDKNPL